MDEAVDRRGRGHLIPEDPVPVGKDQIARDEDGAALVAFGEEREENLGLLRALLDIADVVQNEDREGIEFAQGLAIRGSVSQPRALGPGYRSA